MSDLGKLLSGIGSLLTGLAAIIAVVYAGKPAIQYLSQKFDRPNVLLADVSRAEKQADAIIARAKSPKEFRLLINGLPASPPKEGGLFIDLQHRAKAEADYASAATPEEKKKVLERYWEKSLSEEANNRVNIKFKAEK